MTKELYDKVQQLLIPSFTINSVCDFIEQEIIEAERRMKERCLECIPPLEPEDDEIIRTAISSLK